MIKQSIVVALFSVCYMQGSFGGHTIFDYTNNLGADGFDLKRAYLSYSSDVSDELFFKIRFDVGRHADDRLTTYLKNAYVDYKCDNGDKLSIGLIGTNSFGVQEKNWGYRFIEKSVIDKYGMTNTADFGIGYSKTFGKVKTSMQLLNGEGFKSEDNDGNQAIYLSMVYGESRLDKNNGINFGLIHTFSETDPIENTSEWDETLNEGIGGCTEDGVEVGDETVCSNTVGGYNNITSGVFAGWASNGLRLGLEHNLFETDIKEKATSIYINYNLNEDWDVFVRHDINDINVDDNVDANDLTIIGGIWNVTKGLTVAPNIYLDDTNTYRLTCMFKY